MRAPLVSTTDASLELSGRFTMRAPALSFGPGVTVVLGSNGSGKTTLLQLLATVRPPGAGSLTVSGLDPASPTDVVTIRRSLGYVAQDDTVPRRQTVFDHVDLMAVMREVATTTRVRRRHVHRALVDLDLADLSGERCGRLSGGQRRRVAIAAAWSGEPSFLVLDEPDSGLDDHQTGRLGELLRRRAATATVVVATHRREWAQSIADRTVTINDGLATSSTSGRGPSR